MLQKAQEMQKKMQEMQDEAKKVTVQGESGAGMVKVTMNGEFSASKVEIAEEVLQEEKAVLEDLVTAAINDAVFRVQKHLKESTKNSLGSALPPGFQMPF